jgi:hypothetical protein
MIFKSRGHFCNYCRKILENKCIQFSHQSINKSIWYAWNHPEERDEFLSLIKATRYTEGEVKLFNDQLRAIALRYKEKQGYGSK